MPAAFFEAAGVGFLSLRARSSFSCRRERDMLYSSSIKRLKNVLLTVSLLLTVKGALRP
jgi:hypothetical protein